MHLACPTCSTAFHVDPGELGTSGRSVRCSRCQTIWFATPSDLRGESADALTVLEPASADMPAMAPGLTPLVPEIVSWHDPVVLDANEGPPLVPDAPRIDAPLALSAPEREQDSAGRGFRRRAASPAKADRNRSRLFAVTVILAAIAVIVVGSRTAVVRAVPQFAGLYAAIGLPVNLRGLEFRGVRTTREMQEGIPVLVVEGEVVNITRRPVELPRLRVSVLGSEDQELYSWTTLLPRTVLEMGEAVSFRSRLASPPESGREVLVRFLHRNDFVAAGR